MPTVCPRASDTRDARRRERDDKKYTRARARTYRQRPRLGLVIRRLHLADDVPARVLRGGAVEGVRGELQVFRLLSELERVESAVARKRTVEPRRAVTERERDLRRIARVFLVSRSRSEWWTRARTARDIASPARLSLARTASRSARGAFPLAFFAGAFFAGLFAAGFARDTVFFAGVAVFFTVEVFLVVVVFIASRRVATRSRGGGRSRGRDRSIGPSPSPRGRPTIAGIAVVTSRHSWCVPVPHATDDVAAWKGRGTSGGGGGGGS